MSSPLPRPSSPPPSPPSTPYSLPRLKSCVVSEGGGGGEEGGEREVFLYERCRAEGEVVVWLKRLFERLCEGYGLSCDAELVGELGDVKVKYTYIINRYTTDICHIYNISLTYLQHLCYVNALARIVLFSKNFMFL